MTFFDYLIFMILSIFAVVGTAAGLSDILAQKRHDRRIEEMKYSG